MLRVERKWLIEREKGEAEVGGEVEVVVDGFVVLVLVWFLVLVVVDMVGGVVGLNKVMGGVGRGCC